MSKTYQLKIYVRGNWYEIHCLLMKIENNKSYFLFRESIPIIVCNDDIIDEHQIKDTFTINDYVADCIETFGVMEE